MVLTTGITRERSSSSRHRAESAGGVEQGRQARPTKHAGRLNSLERESPG